MAGGQDQDRRMVPHVSRKTCGQPGEGAEEQDVKSEAYRLSLDTYALWISVLTQTSLKCCDSILSLP